MTIEHNLDKDEMREALDAEVREDEALWDKARVEFDEFRKTQKAQPSEEVEKALHKWLRHHGITLDEEEITAKATKIAAGEFVEVTDVSSTPRSQDDARVPTRKLGLRPNHRL
jgi:methionyl-tRNA synthetase